MNKITVAEISKDKNIIIDIKDNEGMSVSFCDSKFSVKKGSILSDEEMYRWLKHIDLQANLHRSNNVWSIGDYV